MNQTLINVLIVDDEQIVREGLKHIIDWKSLGFCICGESPTAEDAIEKVKKYQPELILLDIRMPRIYGTEFIEIVRNDGYTGEFIILSGYSDFKYAQIALRYSVSFYLVKPIDEEELTSAVLSVKNKIQERDSKTQYMNQYLSKVKEMILQDLLLNREANTNVNYIQLGLSYPIYQVVIYEKYTPFSTAYDFTDLLRISNQSSNSFEHIKLDNQDIILLKGDFALERFKSCLRHYKQGAEKGSPLDSLFLTYGATVPRIQMISASYEACKRLMARRFFCEENQHVLSYEVLPELSTYTSIVNSETCNYYSEKLTNHIQAYDRKRITETLDELKRSLYTSGDDPMAIKHFLADILLQIKQSIMYSFKSAEIPLPHNSVLIEYIENKYYLYEILLYFSELFELVIRSIGNNSQNSVFDNILYYINHNYEKSLRLERIATLFGYNSSYLGQLFVQKLGYNFNAYLDVVRIKEAQVLLSNTDFKIYEISRQVGYKNVDYFHQKFKKLVGQSPTEFRKNPSKQE